MKRDTRYTSILDEGRSVIVKVSPESFSTDSRHLARRLSEHRKRSGYDDVKVTECNGYVMVYPKQAIDRLIELCGFREHCANVKLSANLLTLYKACTKGICIVKLNDKYEARNYRRVIESYIKYHGASSLYTIEIRYDMVAVMSNQCYTSYSKTLAP